MEASGKKHEEMVSQGEQPLNLETPPGLLRREFTTPQNLFYVRNHGNVPTVDPDSYRLTVSGMVEREISLSLEEMSNAFSKETVTTAVQCAGNRRAGLMEAYPIPGETPWGPGAVGNARWSGVPLREVLDAAGVGEGARHAEFAGLDEPGSGWSPKYGCSIPLYKATSPEVLLAYEMNDEPLAAEHGFPLRVVVPGYVGARSVKWLSGISLRGAPSENYFHAHEYRLFPPYITEEPDDLSRGFALGEISINSAICRPADGETVAAGPLTFEGYAVAGGGRRVERVDLSPDEGRTWVGAKLSEDAGPWAWRFWEATLDLGPGPHQVSVRAVDSAADVQPEYAGGIWNHRGYVNNAWHKVRLTAR